MESTTSDASFRTATTLSKNKKPERRELPFRPRIGNPCLYCPLLGDPARNGSTGNSVLRPLCPPPGLGAPNVADDDNGMNATAEDSCAVKL